MSAILPRSDVCEDCGERPAVYIVEVDGEDMALCKGCTGWIVNHSIVAPRVQTPITPIPSSLKS